MKLKRSLLVLLTGAAALAAAPRAWLSDGPPPGHTGGFGEPTCIVCHQPSGGTPAGTLQLALLPASFQPGATYEFEVVSTRAGLTRAGFQLAVRYAAGDSAGKQAGTLAAVEPLRTSFTWDSTLRLVYAHHIFAGTSATTPGSLRWRLRWTAPAARAPVAFHAASVQASDDNSPMDDEVLVTAQQVSPVVP